MRRKYQCITGPDQLEDRKLLSLAAGTAPFPLPLNTHPAVVATATPAPGLLTGGNARVATQTNSLTGTTAGQLALNSGSGLISNRANALQLAVGSLTSTTLNGNPRTYYETADGQIHELAWSGSNWSERVVTTDAGAPPAAAGSALTSTTYAGEPRVYYEGGDGQIHELAHWGGGWHHLVVTTAAGGPAAAAGTALTSTTCNGEPRVYYETADGQIQELAHWGGGWHHLVVTTAAGGPSAAPGSALTATTLGGNPRVYYESAVSQIDELAWSGSVWSNRVLAGNPAADTAYSPVSGSLFGANGPTYLDVHQGAVGDCWLLASLAEVAVRNPSDIRNMFTDLGSITENGSVVELYKVRFFNSAGAPWYVTVDTELPSGGGYYDRVTNGVLWVALAEKAYAEANGAGYVTTQYVGLDYYVALDGGDPSWALQAITGKPPSDYSINPTNIAAAWNAGRLIVLDSSTNAGDNLIVGHFDAQGKAETHSYAMIGYNASSSTPFELYNPWGLSSVVGHTSSYNGHQVYDGPFWLGSNLISQDFAAQCFGTGTAAGSDDLGAMPMVLTHVFDKAREARHHDLALDALQQYDFDLSWVA